MPDYTKFPNLHPTIQNGKKMPIRSAFVQFYEGDENGEPRGGAPIVSLNGLNTRFSVEENFGGCFPKATIEVCNTNNATRDFLTNYMNFRDLQYSRRVVRLYAGYLQPGQGWKDTPYIFGGNVLFTKFTEPPDIWISMDVIYKEIASALMPQQWSIKGVSNATDILTECAKRLKVGLNIRDTPPQSITNFRADGDGKRLLRQLRNYFVGYAIYITPDNKLTITKITRDAPAPGETIWAAREDTGMVGIPIVERWGVELKMLLNADMKPGDWVKLTSKNQPMADSLYRIRRVTHSGELRGNDFFTSIEAYRPLS